MIEQFPRIPGMPLKRQAKMDAVIGRTDADVAETLKKIKETQAFGADPDFDSKEIVDITEEEGK